MLITVYLELNRPLFGKNIIPVGFTDYTTLAHWLQQKMNNYWIKRIMCIKEKQYGCN